MLSRIPPDVREELASSDPDLLDELQQEERASLEADFPKPDHGDLIALQQALVAEWSNYHDEAQRQHSYRYLQHELNPKQKRYLETDTRVYSRLSHNELLRVVAMLTRNPYQVQKPPKGPGDKAYDRAQKQERWAQQFLAQQERRARSPLRRILVDGAAHLGLAAWEVYLTDSYERLNMTKDPDETESEYLRRTEDSLIGADSPVGVRVVHANCLYYRKAADGVGLDVCMVIENKRYRDLYRRLHRRLGEQALADARLPRPGDPGWANEFTGSSPNGEVETIRYYDKRWYAYMVGGKLVEGPYEHGMPGVPIFPLEGVSTSSPNPEESIEGITWGMHSLEKAFDDLLTLATDTAYVFSRPRPVIETDPNGTVTMDPATKKPMVVDLSNPRVAVQLNRGQRIVDAFKGFNSNYPQGLMEKLEALWQRSGLNPIAQGTSPGADPAGYTVNSLMGAANDMYGIILQNDARTFGEVLDFIFAIIRYTIGERVYLPVPGVGRRKGSIEWLGIGPEDIDEIPFVVTIDPTSEANRLARVQVYMTGWKEGAVPIEELQEKGYGAADPDEWQRRNILNSAKARMTPILVEMAIKEAMSAVLPQPSPPGGGGPSVSGGGPGNQEPGAEPAPPERPALGMQGAQASGAPARGELSPSRALAGQNRGYAPPSGMAERGSGR